MDLSTQGDRVAQVADKRMVLIMVGSTVLVALSMFWGTVHSLISLWAAQRTFSHGFLVLPGVLYLTWWYRARLAALAPTPSKWGAAVLFMIGVVWLIGHINGALFVEQIAVVSILPGLVWTTLGTSVTRALAVPLGFLFFALPIGTSLEPWLQGITAASVAVGLQLVGIPVYWQGDLLAIPSRTWEIALDCGGLRYVLPGMATAYLYTAVVYRGWINRVTFLFVCLFLLIAANALRAYGIVLADHLGIVQGTDHRVFSYTIYGIAMSLLFWLGLKWKDAGTPEAWQQTPAKLGGSWPVRKIALAALCAVTLLAIAPLSSWLLAAH